MQNHDSKCSRHLDDVAPGRRKRVRERIRTARVVCGKPSGLRDENDRSMASTVDLPYRREESHLAPRNVEPCHKNGDTHRPHPHRVNEEMCRNGDDHFVTEDQPNTGYRKPKPPVWYRSGALLRIERTPETDKLPKVCPRFLLEKKKCWNRFKQVWEPLLSHFSQKRTSQYHHSECPFHRGYEI